MSTDQRTGFEAVPIVDMVDDVVDKPLWMMMAVAVQLTRLLVSITSQNDNLSNVAEERCNPPLTHFERFTRAHFSVLRSHGRCSWPGYPALWLASSKRFDSQLANDDYSPPPKKKYTPPVSESEAGFQPNDGL